MELSASFSQIIASAQLGSLEDPIELSDNPSLVGTNRCTSSLVSSDMIPTKQATGMAGGLPPISWSSLAQRPATRLATCKRKVTSSGVAGSPQQLYRSMCLTHSPCGPFTVTVAEAIELHIDFAFPALVGLWILDALRETHTWTYTPSLFPRDFSLALSSFVRFSFRLVRWFLRLVSLPLRFFSQG